MRGAGVKLAAFAAVLAVVFGASVAAGSAFGPLRDGGAGGDGEAAHGGMGEMAAGAPDGAHNAGEAGGHGAAAQGGHGGGETVRGLAVSEGGLTLRLERTTAVAGKSAPLRFRIAGPGGETVRDFDVEHTRRMHLIVVRRDLTGFRHLHPTQGAEGGWSVPLRLEQPGAYRVFADFSHHGTPRTLAADLQVDGAVDWRPLPAPAAGATVDGYRVRLTSGPLRAGREAGLAFTVTRAGRAVAVADYLGAKGHLVALREGDLAFLHVHPEEDRLRFAATFPSAGRYRLFLQFRAGGEVHTAAFTVAVPGAEEGR